MAILFKILNSTGTTQRFSANHKTSSEQENRSSFISDQSQMRVKFVLCSSCDWRKNVGWPRLSSLH